MLDCIKRILKRGKRKRHNKMGVGTPWEFHQPQIFKSHSDVGRSYRAEKHGLIQAHTRFSK